MGERTLVAARLALLAAKANHKVEMATAQKEATALHAQMEEVVEALMTQAEQFADSEDLPIIYSSFAAVRSKEDLSSFSRPARVLIDTLSALAGKVQMSTKLTGILSDTLGSFKQQCEELSLKVETLTQDFAQITQELNFAEADREPEQLRECRSCKRLLSKTAEFSAEMVQLRSELNRTDAILAESRRDREKLGKEINNLTGRNKELERELQLIPAFAHTDSLELQRELKHAEMTISALEDQLKNSKSDTDALRTSFLESKSDLEPHESALKKAQSIIKKLNSEAERLSKELFETERLSETYKRDSHQYEKGFREAQIQLQAMEMMQKTEIRLREEGKQLKNVLETVKAETADEIGRLKDYINQLIQENQHFQAQSEALEGHLETLEKEVKDREEEMAHAQEQIGQLQAALTQKTEEIQEVLREADLREEEFEGEIAHIKRVAENTIRSLQPIASPSEESRGKSPLRAAQMPLKRLSGVKRTQLATTAPKATVQEERVEAREEDRGTGDYWKGQVEEALRREAGLKAGLEAIVGKSGSFLKERVKALETLECALRPETERWMMRSEELESQLHSLSLRLVRSLAISRDLQKMVLVKDRQLQDSAKTTDALIAALTETVEAQGTELNSRGEVILEDLGPRVQQLAALHSREASACQRKENSLRDTVDTTTKRLNSAQEKLEKALTDLHRTEDLLERTREELNSRESDLSLIRKALFAGDSRPGSASSGSEMHRIDIFRKEASPGDLAEIQNRIKALQTTIESQENSLQTLRDKLTSALSTNESQLRNFDQDRDSLTQEVHCLEEARSRLELDLRDLTARLRTEKGLREASETLVMDLKTQIETLETAHLGANQAKEQIQRKYEESLAIVGRLEADSATLKGANDRLLSELTNAHADVSALLVFKEKSTNQTVQIERLRDQIGFLQSHSSSEMPRKGLITESVRESEDLSTTRARARSQTRSEIPHLDRVLSQKEDYIRELEAKLEQRPSETPNSTEYEDSYSAEVEKAVRRKVAGYKRSFNKRLEEFEGVLHLIEDTIAEVSEGKAVRAEWQPSSNPSLDTWTRALLDRLAHFSLLFVSSKERELRTYLSVLGVLQTAGSTEEDKIAASSLISGLQSQQSPDLAFTSAQLPILLKRTLGTQSDRRPPSRTTEDFVCMTPYHARLLLTALSSLDTVEIQLIERKESLLQVSDELDALTRTLAETSIRSQAEVAGKMADMFSKFSVQFLQDLKSDLQELAGALRDLREVSRSSPPGKAPALAAGRRL